MNQPAPATDMPKECERCGSNATLWIQQPPACRHPFRVECYPCHHFNKWANEGQLEEAKRRGMDVLVLAYRPQAAKNP